MQELKFSTLALRPELLQTVSSLGYTAMTVIQAESLPAALAGKDVIAQGKTGSGKTVAFALGLLERLNVKRFAVQSLVLCPTRELADQVAKEIRKLARSIHNIKVLTLCGGMPFGPQVGSLAHGAHIVVGTPGRISDHLRKGNLILSNVHSLVLDEADRMLDMGFSETLDEIVAEIPENRQTLLFSATYPDSIAKVAGRVMRDPVMIKVESTHDTPSIEQHFYKVTASTRDQAVVQLLRDHRPDSAVIFCNTKRETTALAGLLRDKGFSALALNGDLEQRDRDRTLVMFANKSLTVLVATDVAARGLDIEALDAVINYQPARDSEVHVHRIGRTGRAGNSGVAVTLVGENETFKVQRIGQYAGQEYSCEALPEAGRDSSSYLPPMITLQIDGGKKQKVRPGDILGALTGADGIAGTDVGKIQMFDQSAFVAVKRKVSDEALRKLSVGKLKGRSFRARIVSK
ncbi:ATP-dependent RNA helicase DbpA [Gilvimarinus polysaccharolyticus]|uniref:ATP-dependent RNA helicase DbpA n=1 Tax=Gilvimarinus polysaccharolyticus TaxID=863921 RepID=UPI0006736490|nr:ATP-dependent RNA helicase DbpA [Gilvimarinus polysaccharolyticus]